MGPVVCLSLQPKSPKFCQPLTFLLRSSEAFFSAILKALSSSLSSSLSISSSYFVGQMEPKILSLNFWPPDIHHPVSPRVGSPVPVVQPVVIGVHVSEHVPMVTGHVSAKVVLIQGVDSKEARVKGSRQASRHKIREVSTGNEASSSMIIYLSLTVVQHSAALFLSQHSILNRYS